MFGSTTAVAAAADWEIVSPPTDGISSLNFSPLANYLCATSWDNNVRFSYTMRVCPHFSFQIRVWEIDPNTRASNPKASTTHEGPVLHATWSAVCIQCPSY